MMDESQILGSGGGEGPDHDKALILVENCLEFKETTLKKLEVTRWILIGWEEGGIFGYRFKVKA